MAPREMETHIVGVPTRATMRSSDEALVQVLESLADEIGGVLPWSLETEAAFRSTRPSEAARSARSLTTSCDVHRSPALRRLRILRPEEPTNRLPRIVSLHARRPARPREP